MKQRASQQTLEKPAEHPRQKIGSQLLAFVQMARKRGNVEVAEAALEWEKAIQERLNAAPDKKAA